MLSPEICPEMTLSVADICPINVFQGKQGGQSFSLLKT